MSRVARLLRDASTYVDATDAAVLLAHVAGRPRSWLYAHGDDELDGATADAYSALLARREAGEPVAYLTGRRGFWRFELAVTPDTLIPRPETERLVELALARLAPEGALRVADLGTGSGAVALALAHERPHACVVATDASSAALAVARGNAAALSIPNIEFRQGDWCAPLAADRFDLIAANPPYIAAADPHLGEGDLRFEPGVALASGDDGLDAIRAIVRDAPARLVPGGWLMLEHGWEQGVAVRALLQGAGFVEVATEQDLEARDRVTGGRFPADAAPR